VVDAEVLLAQRPLAPVVSFAGSVLLHSTARSWEDTPCILVAKHSIHYASSISYFRL
jgi:hypothetical protein